MITHSELASRYEIARDRRLTRRGARTRVPRRRDALAERAMRGRVLREITRASFGSRLDDRRSPRSTSRRLRVSQNRSPRSS